MGDITAFHREPESGYEFVGPVLAEMDVVVAQNERHYTNRDDIFPIGGFTERTVPEHAAALRLGHYDVITFASNHLLDLGPDVLLETIAVLRDLGFAVVGAGENIVEARKPAFVSKGGLTFGFLAYCSVLRPNYEAGPSSPGAAPLRAHTHYHKKDFKPGTIPLIYTFAYPEDLAALLDDIGRAKEQCDFLCVSMHWGLNGIKGAIPMYEKDVAHAAIDGGADVIHGSGPHRLKAFEIYEGKPVLLQPRQLLFRPAPPGARRGQEAQPRARGPHGQPGLDLRPRVRGVVRHPGGEPEVGHDQDRCHRPGHRAGLVPPRDDQQAGPARGPDG